MRKRSNEKRKPAQTEDEWRNKKKEKEEVANGKKNRVSRTQANCYL